MESNDNRLRQPVAANTSESAPAAHKQYGHGQMAPSGQRRKRWLGGVVVLVVVAMVLGAGCLHMRANRGYDENKNINTNEYQALFLTNGQVYFGKLADLNHKYVTIKNIYYLQVQQSLQQSTSAAAAANSQVSLAKLGSELHGPEDSMHVASGQVLFWENLKSDSKVVQAITKYQQGQ